MSDRRQMKNTIVKEISNYLIKYNFDKKIHGQSFWKTIENGRAMIHLHFIDHENDFDITCSVSIRFDALEEMINEGNSLLKPKEKLETSSIGIELGNLIEGKQKRWSVIEETDVKVVISSVCKIIDDVAIPYIQKYENMEEVFKMMVRDDKEIWTFAPLHYRRAMNAIGLAKLLGKENIQEIVDRKRDFLSQRNDFGLNLFNKLAEKIFALK